MNNQLQNILKFATPTSFSEIGQNPKCDKETKVPIVPFYTVHTTIKIPKVRLDDLIKLLEETLSGIKKIDITKKEHFVYELEYFPVDGLKINPKTNKLYQKMWFIHLEAARKGYEKFPHNINNYDDNNHYYYTPPTLSDWCKIEIRLYYSKKNNIYLLEANRMCGESMPFYNFIWNPIKAVFKDKNLLWMMRKNYIKLLEGLGPTEDHVSHYVLDEYVCREICTFLALP